MHSCYLSPLCPVTTDLLKYVFDVLWWSLINPFTAMLAVSSLWKWPMKVPNLKSLSPFFPLHMSMWKDYIKMHSTESRFVIGPSNILFAGVYMCTFQPINFTGWGSEGVKLTTCTVCRWGHPVRLWFQLLRVCGVPWRGRGVGATTSWVLLWPSRGTGVMRWCPRCRVDTIRRRLHLGLRRIWYGGVPVVCCMLTWLVVSCVRF